MRIETVLTVAIMGALVACSAEAPATDPAPPSPEAAVEAAAPQEPARAWAREDAEFAFRCRGLLSAAYAARAILPAGEGSAVLDGITIGTTSRWASEAFTRADAAGLSEVEQNELLSSTSRVLNSRETIDEAMPEIEACLEVIR